MWRGATGQFLRGVPHFPTPFPGAQLLIPPALFARFNRLRESGAIAVFPYRGQQE